MASHKRKAQYEVPVGDEEDLLKITPLGAGQEVGRSSILLEYKGKRVLLDAGVHPAYSGLASLPYFDEVDLETVDVLLVTHFHVDHAASVPYVMRRTDFKGRTFMTHPTKAIFQWLMRDYIRVSDISENGGNADKLFDEKQLEECTAQIEAVDYYQEFKVKGITFQAYPAGHVLGAAMFLIEIAGVKVLYTGDYSREEDRHLMAAERPDCHVDVLITESTYGVQNHVPRIQKEIQFTELVHKIVARGGRCLMPVFALGRAQELQLILDEYWESENLKDIPIYYASKLATRSIRVYKTYIQAMNKRIQERFKESNPFTFKHISSIKETSRFEDSGPCVVMASPGMLQNGFSRELFERWAPDPKNGLVITGYCVENTPARRVMNTPTEVESQAGDRKIPLRMSVDYISFSAHVDGDQNIAFIGEVKAQHVILVHGEANTMTKLKHALEGKYTAREDNNEGYKPKIYNPRNCVTVELYFRGEKMAKIVGSLASKYPTENQLLHGVVMEKNHQLSIMSNDDLNELEGLITTVITQRQVVPFEAGFALLKWHLEMMYGSVTETELSKEKDGSGQPGTCLRVFDTVDIKKGEDRPHQIILEWIGNAMNDMVADSVLAVIMSIDCSPASVKVSHKPCSHSHSHDSKQTDNHRLEDIAKFLKEHFGQVEVNGDEEVIVHMDGAKATVDCLNFTVKSESDVLQQRVSSVIQRVQMAINPISEIYTGSK